MIAQNISQSRIRFTTNLDHCFHITRIFFKLPAHKHIIQKLVNLFMQILIITSSILIAAYIIILSWMAKGLKRLVHQSRSEQQPLVSIIVAAHNEAHNLSDCLESLLYQSYPHQLMELIIVDDRSDDKTPHILNEYSKKDQRIRIISISAKVKGFAPKKYAIDKAIQSANGEIILLTDADGRPGPEWVASMVSYYTPETDMVIGYAPYQNKPSASLKRMF